MTSGRLVVVEDPDDQAELDRLNALDDGFSPAPPDEEAAVVARSERRRTTPTTT